MPTIHFTKVSTPIGELLVTADDFAVKEILFPREARTVTPQRHWQRGGALLDEARRQLCAYFEHRLQQFDLQLAPDGTAFQQTVWAALQEIPYGRTISYKELADRIGKPAACRAVGSANGRNPIPIVIPCHRVIGSDGSLTGFGGGLSIKRRLLGLENPRFAGAGSATTATQRELW